MAALDLVVHPNQAPRVESRDAVRVRADSLYTNHKGEEKASIRKRTDKAVTKLQDILGKVLEPDEAVLYVARAQEPASIWEQLMFGWYIYSVTSTTLVFTNRRLLHFLVKRDGSWKQSLRSLHWGDLAEAKVKGWVSPVLQLRYANGKKEKYWGVRRDDAKKIKILLGVLQPASVGESTAAEGMVPLCPDCQAVLTPRVYQCAQCGLSFKDEQTLVRRSLLLPGGGYFYAGHAFLGIGDFVVETLLSALTLLWVLVALGFPEPDLQPLEAASTPVQALVVAGIFGGLLAIEKWLTVHHGRRFLRQFIPVREQRSSARWPFYGLISVLTVGLLVWAWLPKQEVIAEVAPDLVVVNAHFGLFGSDAQGNLQFSPASVVPLQEGQGYGWVLRVRTPRERVKWREEVLSGEEVAGENEGESAPEGGVFASAWTVGPLAPPGLYKLRVYVEGVLVREFTFQLQ